MEPNPYLQPGKHFVPRKAGGRVVGHKGMWNLVYNGVVITHCAYYGKCVKDRKDFARHRDYKNFSLFRIVPCLG